MNTVDDFHGTIVYFFINTLSNGSTVRFMILKAQILFMPIALFFFQKWA